MTSPEETLSIAEAARVLGVHPNTLRAWSDAGRIRSYRINARGDRRFRRTDLDAFLDATEIPESVASSPRHVASRTAAGSAAEARSAREDVVATIRCELETAASLLGRETGPSGLDGALARAVRILRARHGHVFVGVWAHEDDRLVPRAAAGAATPLAVAAAGSSFIARSFRAQEAIAEMVGGADVAWLAGLDDAGAATAAAIPGGDEAWGILAMVDRAGTRVEDHVSLLPVIASIVGVAVRTALVVDEATRGRLQAEALRRVALDLVGELDLDRLFASVLEHASTLFSADRAAIILGRPGGRVQAMGSLNLSDGFVEASTTLHPWSVPAQALRDGRPVMCMHYADDPRGEALREQLLGEGIDTVCAAPLFDGTEPLGTLNLYHDLPHAWTGQELETLEAFAAEASMAIRNARNVERTEAWAAQLQSIQHLGGELGRLSSTEEVGRAIVSEMERLIDFHNVRVYELRDDELFPVALRGKIGEYTDETPDVLRLRAGEGITGWVAKHGIAQYLPDAEADPRAMTIEGTDTIAESMLLAPMMFEGRVLGVIVLSKLGLDQFAESHLRLLVIFANAAAQAFATAEAAEMLRRQSDALERRLRSQRALLQITESLLTTLDARAILEGIVERLGELVTYDNVCIELLDGRSGTLRPIIARGADAERYLVPWEPGEEGIATWVVAHGEPQLVVDERADPRVLVFEDQGPVDGSIIAVPLRGPVGVAGVLTVERSGRETPYDEDDFELVRLLAGQVSIALRNAEHYRAARLRAETDGLTGLLNYASFRDRLGALALSDDPFSLLMLDLDGFKAVNTAYLWQGGNDVLQRAGNAIRSAARESDDVFRFGGDEFCVLLSRTDGAGARAVAERVRDAVAMVEPPSPIRGRARPRVSASVGIATYPLDADTADALVDVASRGAYYAKAQGGDRISTAAESQAIADAFESRGPTPVESDTTAIDDLLAEPTLAGGGGRGH
jgi:diguanylate cyclase (GGDEF)-like protein/excisionase family DNA binding protein